MTIEQFISDLDALVDLVRERFGKDKVAILGHSWGSALGVLYTARFPQNVAVYAGVAQVADCAASEASSYARAVAEAERQNNRAVLRKLRAIGPPPHTPQRLFVERMCAERLRGGLKRKALWNTTRMLLGVPEASLLELRATIRAFRFSIESMWSAVSRLNLIAGVPALEVPVVFMLGRGDPWIPAETNAAYFDVLRRRRSSCGSTRPDMSRSSTSRPGSWRPCSISCVPGAGLAPSLRPRSARERGGPCAGRVVARRAGGGHPSGQTRIWHTPCFPYAGHGSEIT